MLLRAVFVVVAALAASSAAQYADTSYKETDSYDPTYGGHKPDTYGTAADYEHYGTDSDKYSPPDPYDDKPKPYDSVLPPATDYGYTDHGGYGHGGYGYGGYGKYDVLSELRKKVYTRIEAQKQQIQSIIEFRDQTLASIDKISTLTAAWCRSK